jgi:hypothetical protein
MKSLMLGVLLLGVPFSTIAADYVNMVPQTYTYKQQEDVQNGKSKVDESAWFEQGYEYRKNSRDIDGAHAYIDFLTINDKDVNFFVGLNRDKPSKIEPFAAKLVDCKGVGNQCLVLENVIKIYVKKNFVKDGIYHWVWQDYKYFVSVTMRYFFAGKMIDVYEIAAYCKTCEVKSSFFQYNEEIGIVNFQYLLGDSGGFYMLSDDKGFLAKAVE